MLKNKPPIIINFIPNSLGCVNFFASVRKSDGKSHGDVEFKLDSGSHFTTLNYKELRRLGYNDDFLSKCPEHKSEKPTRLADGSIVRLRYIRNQSIKFDDREIQGLRIFFMTGVDIDFNLFGSDILKYFYREIDYDAGEFRLMERVARPALSEGERELHIYSLTESDEPFTPSNIFV